MRDDIVFRIYGVHRGRAKDSFFGAFRTRAEADAKIEELAAKQMHGASWAARYHDAGFVIRETKVETDFEIPPRPAPRDRYVVKTESLSNGPGVWPSTNVEVYRRSAEAIEPVGTYLRNYGLLQTFEPFRQGDRDFALISRDYTATAVMDLATGAIVAEETPSASGFCPVGFYVPDWWDVNDDSIIPGSESWDADCEWPTGRFGFVWGCVWGDDSSWKVQHLDLSRVSDGVIARDERYGYLALVTDGWDPPWRDLDRTLTSPPSRPPPFIEVSSHAGVARVDFRTELRFDMATGKLNEWPLKTLTREESGPE
jgi:hypothetical protein